MNWLENFFGVALRGQTYLNALYLLLAFPLGLFYFVFLVTGVAVGLPLIILWVGLLVLATVFAAWWGFLVFERYLAIGMLKVDIPPMNRQDMSGLTLWQKFVVVVRNPVTWKGLVYLFARFPLGIISFVVLVSLLAVSAGLIAAPFYYQYATSLQPHFYLSFGWVTNPNSIWVVDTPVEAGLASLAGLLLAIASMHVFNGMAWLSAQFARLMLGNFSTTRPAAIEAIPQEEPSI